MVVSEEKKMSSVSYPTLNMLCLDHQRPFLLRNKVQNVGHDELTPKAD